MIATVLAVLRKELRETFRDRRTLVNSLLFGPVLAPLFFILVMKLALERSVVTSEERVPVTVVNASAAPNLVQRLRERGEPRADFHHRFARPRRDLAHDGIDDSFVGEKVLAETLSRDVLHVLSLRA